MALSDPATIIASALRKTFEDRGLLVEVRYERDVMRDQAVWAIIHGTQRETLRANMHDLHIWDRSKPVPFLGDGPEIYIGPAQSNLSYPAIGHSSPLIGHERNESVSALQLS